MGSILSIPANDSDLLSTSDSNDTRSLRKSEEYSYNQRFHRKWLRSLLDIVAKLLRMSQFAGSLSGTELSNAFKVGNKM